MTDAAQDFEAHSLPERYSSFLLRCSHVGKGELRIKIEHIQSGDSTQVDTYEAAVAWLAGHCATVPDGKEVHRDEGARNGSEREATKEKHKVKKKYPMKLRQRVLVILCSVSLLAVTAVPVMAKPLAYTDDKEGICPRGFELIDTTDHRYYENADLNGNDLICVK